MQSTRLLVQLNLVQIIVYDPACSSNERIFAGSTINSNVLRFYINDVYFNFIFMNVFFYIYCS